MSTLTLNADVRQLELLNKELGLYSRLSGKTIEETLDKKGRDLGIQLYRLYDAHRFGKGQPRGFAAIELSARTLQGRGTEVRPELRARYRSARAALTADIRSAGQIRRRAKELGVAGLGVYRAAAKAGIVARARRAHLWRKIVGEEIALRQSGAGALGASFLLFRRIKGVDPRTRVRKNRSGKVAGFIERGPGYFRLVGETEGLDIVDNKHGIGAAAVMTVRADMAPYIERKLIEGMAPFKTLKAS